jgi:hypothetical protein
MVAGEMAASNDPVEADRLLSRAKGGLLSAESQLMQPGLHKFHPRCRGGLQGMAGEVLRFLNVADELTSHERSSPRQRPRMAMIPGIGYKYSGVTQER